jgi:hypothetical protein
MTTTIQFSPSQNSNFQFQAKFDGNTYNVIVNWNLFGVRYFINIYDLSGHLIVARPLIGSPLGYALLSVVSNGSFAVATTTVPHTYAVGTVVPLVISGCNPTSFNGTFNCNIINTTQFTYPLVIEAATANTVGNVVYNLSMTAGYFNSTLVYFPDNQQFIINP